MSKSIRIVSPNIVRDREFRALLQASATGGGHPGPDEELGLIVKQALGKGSDKTFKLSEGEAADVYEAVEKNSNREVGNRDQVEVKAKLFLRDFSAEKAKEAIKHTLTVLGKVNTWNRRMGKMHPTNFRDRTNRQHPARCSRFRRGFAHHRPGGQAGDERVHRGPGQAGFAVERHGSHARRRNSQVHGTVRRGDQDLGRDLPESRAEAIEHHGCD